MEEEKKTCSACGVELEEGKEHTCAKPEGESEGGEQAPAEEEKKEESGGAE